MTLKIKLACFILKNQPEARHFLLVRLTVIRLDWTGGRLIIGSHRLGQTMMRR